MKLTVFAMVLSAALLHALWNFAARKASGNLGVMWFGTTIATMACLPFALFIWPSSESIRSALPYMLATGMIHALYFAMLARSYEEGEISFVYPIARGTGVAGTSIALGLQRSNSKGELRSGVMAFFVGCTIVGYSLVDKVGVGLIHPVFYIFFMFFFATLLLSPYVLLNHRERCIDAWRKMKRYIFLIGLGSMATYLIILFAFQLGKVSYIVAAREFSVVIGSALGITILGERVTGRKCLGILTIALGLVLVKLAH